MARVKKDVTIKEYQLFNSEVYGLSNDRYFSTSDMLTNIQRFLMRGLKGIRKGKEEKIIINMIISISWFMSLMNQLHIDIEDEVWQRFPYLCSYCGSAPCKCRELKVKSRKKPVVNRKLRPKTLNEYQTMFEYIYPSSTRNLETAGIHLAEEIGELAEAILTYQGSHKNDDFYEVTLESADLFSCFLAVFNSLNTKLSSELAALFTNNCHECHGKPCTCSFNKIMGYKS